jgi:predicted NUDIX family NTP pyrophosphohydrolase
MRTSAGLLLYRGAPDGPQVLIGHMGGPYWAAKEDHAWSIPKGEIEPGEDPLTAARREFAEEIGAAAPAGETHGLGQARQRTGKLARVWAQQGDLDVSAATSNTFEMEWPPHSGQLRSFPEIDRVGWFDIDTARKKLVQAQEVFLDRLAELLSRS